MFGGYYDDDDVGGGGFASGFPMHPALARHLRERREALANQRFEARYRCFPVNMMPGSERENVNFGGKCILPPSALDKLTRLNISYPMLFELRNEAAQDRRSHLGVLEFIAEEGRIYIPQWMMRNLDLEPGALLHVLSTDIPLGSFVQLQAQSPDFLEISDPKAVLENVMRNFSTLTKGDVFQFKYDDKLFDMAVLEVRPGSSSNAICVVETDLEVDFAEPVGYVPPKAPAATRPGGGHIRTQAGMAAKLNFQALVSGSIARAAAQELPAASRGGGQKLSGKAVAEPAIPLDEAMHETLSDEAAAHAIPTPLRVQFGTLFFGYTYKAPPSDADDAKDNDHEDKEAKFSGAGQSLKAARRAKPKAASGSGGNPIEID